MTSMARSYACTAATARLHRRTNVAGRSRSSPSPQRNGSSPPTAAIGATGELSNGVNELMMRIGFPLDGLASARDHHAGPVRWLSTFDLDCCRQVHGRGHAAKDSLGVVNQPNELAQVGLPPQVDHSLEFWVMVPALADLNELDLPAKVVDDLLVSFRLPPFYGDIKFPAGYDNPERNVLAREFVHLRVP